MNSLRLDFRKAFHFLVVFSASLAAASSFAQPAPTPDIEVEVPPMATPRPVPDGRFHIQLADGSLLVGKIVGSDVLKLKSVVGIIDIPVKKISTIRFEKNRVARVTFRNDDTLSGELEATGLRLATSFGEAEIDFATIVAVLCHEQFTADGLVIRRTIRNTNDAEIIEWESFSVATPSVSAPRYYYPADPVVPTSMP